MANTNGNQFLPDEIITMRHCDKKTGVWSESEFPKVGGRLRLAHEHNGSLEINSEIVQYDGNIAVVRVILTTDKGSFTGIGMASLERDVKIAPAILELAETRAIARSLRFAGYGVEFCSAEEVSHLEQERPALPPINEDPFMPKGQAIYCPATPGKMQIDGGNGRGVANGNGGVNGTGNGKPNGRLSQKQQSFLVSLAEDRGYDRKRLDDMSRERYGVVVNFLSKNDASSFIGELTSN
ncbi:MAG: hypothetical protein P4L69_17435 [Desulfosporosinus sp.]|nr:hypothetical protein [Desulfosporosinus sp.]